MATVVAYVLTMLAVFFAITALPQAFIGGLASRAVGRLAGGLLGSILAWLLVDLLWVWLEGAHIPIAALGAALAYIFLHGAISKEELTGPSHWLMAAEAWAIVLVGIYLIIFPADIRWY